MKTTIYLVLTFALALYIAEPKISFKPFSIEFARPYEPFAWFFLIIAIVLLRLQEDKIAYKRGVNDTIELIEEQLKNK